MSEGYSPEEQEKILDHVRSALNSGAMRRKEVAEILRICLAVNARAYAEAMEARMKYRIEINDAHPGLADELDSGKV